jgi:integrase
MPYHKKNLKIFSYKERISKENFLSCKSEDCEKFTFTVDGKEHSIYFTTKGASNRKLNRLPIILNCNTGRMDKHVALYLYQFAINRTKEGTVGTIAQDLKDFLVFCDSKDINYLKVPRNMLKKPIYLFRKNQMNLVRDGQIAPSTAKRKVSTVIRFHKDLIDEHGEKFFEYAPFTYRMFTFTDQKGLTKTSVTQKEQIKYAKETPADAYKYIEDGGRLKPLTRQEQDVLHEVLKGDKNTEMKYGIYTALNTGARLQSIFTLSVGDLEGKAVNPDAFGVENIVVQAGRSAISDAKNGKNINIEFPYLWIEKLKVYAQSDRYKKRRDKYFSNLGIASPTEEQKKEVYLFLSRDGNPFYDRDADLKHFNHQNKRGSKRIGNKVNSYFSNQLRTKMRENLGQDFSFRFHDLRATFGVNLRDQMLEEYPENSTEILREIQRRLSHNNQSTTELYVKYNPSTSMIKKINHNYRGVLGMTSLTEDEIDGRSSEVTDD